MQKNVPKTNIEYSIDILLQYKKGEINLHDACAVFSDLTGVRPHIAREYISAMKRKNIIQFNSGRIQ